MVLNDLMRNIWEKGNHEDESCLVKIKWKRVLGTVNYFWKREIFVHLKDYFAKLENFIQNSKCIILQTNCGHHFYFAFILSYTGDSIMYNNVLRLR